MSALLSEADLNDFISPGLACIKTTNTNLPVNNNQELEVGVESPELEKVSISLQDCLACSGCITSSEEILLSKQSHNKFLSDWRSGNFGGRPLAVSIPPQSRLSLAQYFSMKLDEFDRCFQHLLHAEFNATYVVGTQIGRSITISRTNKCLKEKKDTKPVLCSVCPGFVLYAEKTKSELLPYMLDVKSPQQITGSLLKKEDPNIYHLTIMPCFDKKLEASRKDCESEVDCVITPREFVTMLEELSINFKSYATEVLLASKLSPSGWDVNLHWSSNDGSSSGGFAYQYLHSLLLENQGSEIITLQGKNTDVLEYRLISLTGDVIASSSVLYGFRNIQNLVRKLLQKGAGRKRAVRGLRKRGQKSLVEPPALVDAENKVSRDVGNKIDAQIADPLSTNFIEIMACPGGCINGGGLLNGETNSTRRRLLSTELSQHYYSIKNVDIASVSKLYDDPFKNFRYDLHEVHDSELENNVLGLGNSW